MKQYTCTVPFIDDMGSISPFVVTETPMDTKEQYALWRINTMRDHDGKRHLTRMPKGTTYELLKG